MGGIPLELEGRRRRPQRMGVAEAQKRPLSCIPGVSALRNAWEWDLPYVRLLCANYMIYGVYQDLVHQNLGDHLDG